LSPGLFNGYKTFKRLQTLEEALSRVKTVILSPKTVPRNR